VSVFSDERAPPPGWQDVFTIPSRALAIRPCGGVDPSWHGFPNPSRYETTPRSLSLGIGTESWELKLYPVERKHILEGLGQRSMEHTKQRRISPKPPAILVLLFGDDVDDAEAIRQILEKCPLNIHIKMTVSYEAFEQSLSKGVPDIVISDSALLYGDGNTALRCARRYSAEVPFIVVAGVSCEDQAIAILNEGATDYVLKHRLNYLVPAISRALQETDERFQRRRAETRFRELSSHLQQILEEERTRIARVVHDEVAQSLAGLKLDLAGLSDQLPKGLSKMKGKIFQMMRGIDHAIHTVRSIITDLRPGILDDLGIIAALEWQGADFQKRTGIECIVTTTLEDAVRRPKLDTVIFRIVQGLLANVLQHADSTKVRIHSTENNGEYVLVVEDNGRGISPEDFSDKPTMGILGMRELAAKFGGTIVFEPLHTRGTRVTVNIPWQSTTPVRGGGI